MDIKIKNIKRAFLILACIFLAGINYFNYVKADTSKEGCNKTIDFDCDGLTNDEETVYGTNSNIKDTDDDGYSDGVEIESGYDPLRAAPEDKIARRTTNSNDNESELALGNTSLTDEVTRELEEYMLSKEGQIVSNSDLTDFVSQNFSEKLGSHISLNSLPEIDEMKIKVLPQEYGTLSEDERKIRLRKDATGYYSEIAYALASNAPVEMLLKEDFSEFLSDFESHFVEFAGGEVDYEYFANIGKKTDMFLEQISSVEVPETMLSMHIKGIRLIKGCLSLREMNYSENDPLAKMMLMVRVQDLIGLVTVFFEEDFQNYNNSLK